MYRRSWKDKLRDLVMIGGAISVVLVLMFFFNRGKSSDAPMASAGMVENDGPQETVELLPKVKKRPDRHRVHTWKPEKTFNGFTVYPLSGTEEVLLIKMDGEVVHRWNLDVERARLLPNCNLLVIHGSKWGKKQPKWNTL